MANLIRYDPFGEILSWNHTLDRMLKNFYPNEGFGYGEPLTLRVPLDVVENDDEFIVKANVAGIDPEDINISFTDNNLSIKGEVTDVREEKSKESRYHLHERRYGSFSRTITLPSVVDVDNIDAETKNGVLMIHLPKKEEVKPHRIEIKNTREKDVVEGKSKG